MQFTVTRVRRESSADGSHKHLEGVCTTSNSHYTRKEVVDSIKAGNTWVTSDHSTENNLENLPDC